MKTLEPGSCPYVYGYYFSSMKLFLLKWTCFHDAASQTNGEQKTDTPI